MAKIISVSFEVEVPDDSATDKQVQEWLEYELHQRGTMSADSPLALCDIDAYGVSFN